MAKTHLQLGEELQLFFQHPYHPGNVTFLPYGENIRNLLKRYLETSMGQRKYYSVKTPCFQT